MTEPCAGLPTGVFRRPPPRTTAVLLHDSISAWARSLRAPNLCPPLHPDVRDATWGVRHLDDVVAEAALSDRAPAEIVAMPANNLSVVFRRKP